MKQDLIIERLGDAPHWVKQFGQPRCPCETREVTDYITLLRRSDGQWQAFTEAAPALVAEWLHEVAAFFAREAGWAECESRSQ